MVLWVQQADGGHVPVDAADRTGVLGQALQTAKMKNTSVDRAPVAGEARLVADVEPLAEQPHPLDAGGGLQLSQATVATFTFIHLRDNKDWAQEEKGAGPRVDGGH